ncbi:transcriptional regulator [Natronospirillum operosum]|uniref:Transcriptional regulator n=1 Tax=Natronospirillum operosum TaxID=2759953 RepID=A0A4Z0WJC7_9GAMM|nr:metalloregulator ArsR/SmtB family transcription factor [Natronospirillum operosum]TGG95611.1 transcriptional regulator [Natronospirillum operosum]
MTNHEVELNQLFSALSDPTRRGVLARLCEGPGTVSELARPYDMTLPSFTQHLKVLERSGLVRSHKEGRSRLYQVEPEQLKRVEGWLEQQRQVWEQRLDRLDDYLLQMKEKH